MINNIFLREEYKLIYQNTSGLELWKKKSFVYILDKHVRSAAFYGEKFIVANIPLQLHKMYSLFLEKTKSYDFTTKNIIWVFYNALLFFVVL